MKFFYQVIVVGLVFSILFMFGTHSKLFAANSRALLSRQTIQVSGVNLKDFKNGSLKALRLLKQKQELQRLRDVFDAARHKGACRDPKDPQPADPKIEQSKNIYQWIVQDQAATPTGLVTSFPEDANLKDQAFTYDEALAGLVLLAQKDPGSAKKIFDFYETQWEGRGFYTAYNTQNPEGPKIETHRIVGPTAWIGLFSLRYYEATGDERALALATKTGKWVAENVPHRLGGVAMGEDDIWSGIISIENNLSYYALAEGLSKKAGDTADRALFSSEKDGVAQFIKNQGYDASTGLFKRGPSDQTGTFDVNSWAILVFGAEKLKDSFGIDAAVLVQSVENAFSVQKDGSFGGSVSTSKGFDFSDASNAATVNRPGMKWVEGTNHMVIVYLELARALQSANAVLAKQYLDKAAYFLKLNAQNAVTAGGKTSYGYTDSPAGTLIFHDIQSWTTPFGPGVASAAWVYFAVNGINPLTT